MAEEQSSFLRYKHHDGTHDTDEEIRKTFQDSLFELCQNFLEYTENSTTRVATTRMDFLAPKQEFANDRPGAVIKKRMKVAEQRTKRILLNHVNLLNTEAFVNFLVEVKKMHQKSDRFKEADWSGHAVMQEICALMWYIQHILETMMYVVNEATMLKTFNNPEEFHRAMPVSVSNDWWAFSELAQYTIEDIRSDNPELKKYIDEEKEKQSKARAEAAAREMNR